MTTIGYHGSHEQFSPRELLDYVQHAEDAGFDAAMCSDHFRPWNHAQGHSGYSFAWLGAALQATSLPMGLVCAPGYRHHPAVVAQAVATLEVMFPGRVWASFGSGQALNESITGEPWPTKSERNERLRECVDVIRDLWAGKTVTHHGHIDVVDATLYTRPERPPPAFAAAITPETARVSPEAFLFEGASIGRCCAAGTTFSPRSTHADRQQNSIKQWPSGDPGRASRRMVSTRSSRAFTAKTWTPPIC